MPGIPNPFAPPTETRHDKRIDVDDTILGSDLLVTGPSAPRLSPTLEAPAAPWPTQNVEPFEGIAVLGLHGGAGATTLTMLLGAGAHDVGRSWPIPRTTSGTEDVDLPLLPVLVVARTDHHGLSSSDRFIRSWANGQLTGSQLSALVLIEAGPRTSDARKKATKRLLRMVPRGTHIPWMDSWLDVPPDPARLPGRIKRIIKLLNTPTS